MPPDPPADRATAPPPRLRGALPRRGILPAMALPERGPFPTVDIIIEMEAGRICLIERRFPPLGWALPGGFVDDGESLEQAAVREAREETSLTVTLVGQLHTYSDPARDARLHTCSTVFVARATGTPRAEDDAKGIALVDPDELPAPLCFDHAAILADYRRWRRERWPLF